MESSSGESTPKRHARHGSGRASLARRSTRGPLDINDSPLIGSPTSPSSVTTTSQLLSPVSTTGSQFPTQSRTPRLPSPAPGSNLSFQSALTSTPGASFRTAHSSLSQVQQKDFSYLLRPEIYHPLTLLEVPPPFRAASAQPDPTTPLPDLIASGNFRSAAIKAAQLLISSEISGSNYTDIFELVYIRLSCLTLCNQTALAAQEVKALEDLNYSYYKDDVTGTHLVPWELRVLAVRLQGMGFEDARRGVMGYYDLAREARSSLTSLKKSRTEKKENETEDGKVNDDLDNEITLWESRLSELGIRVASALVEMGDLQGAARHLSTLKSDGRLGMQRALLWLCLGDIDAARSCISPASSDLDDNEKKVVEGLAQIADGNYGAAVKIWQELISSAGDIDAGETAMWRQNLGVCLLYLGKIDAARDILESLTDAGQSFHALTFNLCTIYELCTERSRALKIGLAEKVAENRENGTGVIGWEKVNADFKL